MSTVEALQSIYTEHGVLTPDLVVEVASDPEHVLHGRFVWDDTEAARRFRLVQASGLIRSVHVKIDRGEDSDPVRVRAFVADREIGLATAKAVEDEELLEFGRYRPVREVVESDVMRSAWFRSLARDWQALKRRAGESKEFAKMVLDDLRDVAG